MLNDAFHARYLIYYYALFFTFLLFLQPLFLNGARSQLNQFSDSIPVLDFPTDRPRPPFRTFSAAREDWDLDPALVLNSCYADRKVRGLTGIK